MHGWFTGFLLSFSVVVIFSLAVVGFFFLCSVLVHVWMVGFLSLVYLSVPFVFEQLRFISELFYHLAKNKKIKKIQHHLWAMKLFSNTLPTLECPFKLEIWEF